MAAKSYIVAPGVYVNETSSSRSYIVAPGVYLNETTGASGVSLNPGPATGLNIFQTATSITRTITATGY